MKQFLRSYSRSLYPKRLWIAIGVFLIGIFSCFIFVYFTKPQSSWLAKLMSTAYADFPTYTPPILHYNFDDATTSATLLDQSGNNTTGTWSGTLGSQYTAGKYGGAGNFDGSTNYVTFSTANIATSAGTVSMWLKPNAQNGTLAFGTSNNLSGNTSRIYVIFASTGTSDVDCMLGNQVLGTYTLTVGAWSHIACTWNGTTAKMYVNGIDETTTSTFGGLSNLDTVGGIGALHQSSSYTSGYYSGLIDEIRLYNYALSIQQIQQDMKTSALSYYSFDEGSGSTTTPDESNNGNTGTWHGTLGHQYTLGEYGDAGNFDGSTNYVSLNTTHVFATQSGTVSMWLNPNANNNNVANSSTFAFASVNTGSSNTSRIYLQFSPNVGARRINCLLGATSFGYTTLASGWHHVACTWNGSTGSFYVDGTLQATTTFGGLSNLSTMGTIGSFNTQGYYTGTIDEPRFYQYAQTATQIQQDMSSFASLSLFPDTIGFNMPSVSCRTSNSPIQYINDQPDNAYSNTLPSDYWDYNIFNQCQSQMLAAIDYLASQGVHTVRLWPILTNFAYQEVATTTADTPPSGYFLITQGAPVYAGNTQYYWEKYTDISTDPTNETGDIGNFDTVLNKLKTDNMKAYITLEVGNTSCGAMPIPTSDMFDRVHNRRYIPPELINASGSGTFQNEFLTAEKDFITRYKDNDTIVGYDLVNEIFTLFDAPNDTKRTTDTNSTTRPGNQCGINYTDLTQTDDDAAHTADYYRGNLNNLKSFVSSMYTAAKSIDTKHFFTFDDPVNYYASDSGLFSFFDPYMDVYDIHAYKNLPPSNFFTSYPFLLYQPYLGTKPLIFGEAGPKLDYSLNTASTSPSCLADSLGDVPQDSLCQNQLLTNAQAWVAAAKQYNVSNIFFHAFGSLNGYGYHTYATQPTAVPTPTNATPCLNPTTMLTPTSGITPTSLPTWTPAPTSPTVPTPTFGNTPTMVPTIPGPTYSWYPAGSFANSYDAWQASVTPSSSTITIPIQYLTANWGSQSNTLNPYNFRVVIVDGNCNTVYDSQETLHLDSANNFTMVLSVGQILTSADTYTITISPTGHNIHYQLETYGESFSYTPGNSYTLPTLLF